MTIRFEFICLFKILPYAFKINIQIFEIQGSKQRLNIILRNKGRETRQSTRSASSIKAK